jgi:chromosome segregation ATPase
MHRVPLFLLSSLLILPTAFSQTSQPDPQLTQALLTEIRHLRADLQTTAATVQRVQIVMYRLQAETEVLNRATGRAEMAHRQCDQARQQRTFAAQQIDRLQSALPTARTPEQRAELEQTLANLRSNLEMSATEDQECQAEVQEAELQLRAEQAKMSDLQDQLDKLDKALAKAGLEP